MIPEYVSWKIIRKIGSGSFGTVYEIQREDFGYTYRAALKVISIPQNESEIETIRSDGMDDESVTEYFKSVAAEIVKEFELMFKLRGHTNIVNYEDHAVKAKKDGIGWDILIRMELLTSLNRYISQNEITRRDVIKLGIDLCNALERCQAYNVIHRDIKPDNIFVSDQGDFKLGDFGIARTVEKTMSGLSKKGTYNYMAPEVYKGEAYGYSVDIYSLGLVMYRLVNNNRTPFLPPYPQPIKYKDQELALIKRMGGEKIPMPCQDDTRLAEIILKACSYRPKDRYSSPGAMREELQALLLDGEKSNSAVSSDRELMAPIAADSINEEDIFNGNAIVETSMNRVEAGNTSEKQKHLSASEQRAAEHLQEMSDDNEDDEDEITVALFSDRKDGFTNEQGYRKNAQGNKKYNGDFEIEEDGETEIAVRPVKKIFSLKTIAAGTVFLIVLGILGTSIHYFNTTTKVPDVSGMVLADAKKQLDEYTLFCTQTVEENSDEIPKGSVIRLEEQEKRMKKNSGVTLVVSLGTQKEVPNVVNLEKEKAVKQLKEIGLQVTTETIYSELYKEGMVAEQDLSAGTPVYEGDGIVLKISMGTQPFSLENYVGKKWDEVKTKIDQLGLTAEKKSVYSSDTAKNKVMKQSVKAGSEVKKGDKIIFTVSKGVEQITVPNIVGMSRSKAEETLKKAGFKIGSIDREYSSSVDENKVVWQDETPGSKMNKGSYVSYRYSLGEEPTRQSSGNSSGNNGSSGGSYSAGGNGSSGNSKPTAAPKPKPTATPAPKPEPTATPVPKPAPTDEDVEYIDNDDAENKN